MQRDNKSKEDTEAILVETLHRIYISFRGSHEIDDWVTDSTIAMSEIGGGKSVHRGFNNAFNDVKDNWIKIIQELIDAKVLLEGRFPDIVLTGHSLGGALAQRFAHELERLNIAVHSVYTFGSPRLGDEAFAKDYNKVLPLGFRLVNDDDIVPKVPLKLLGYEHANHFVFLDGFQKAIPTSEKGDFKYGFDVLSNTAEDWAIALERILDLAKSASDHSMPNYIKKLEYMYEHVYGKKNTSNS